MKNLSVILTLFLFLILRTYGQNAGETEIQKEDLSLHLKSISFVKNNEYFNPIVEGYTLLGVLFRPELEYSPSEKITVRAGAHLLKYWGTSEFTQVRPLLSGTYNIKRNTSLTIGSLSGCDKHRLFDPHFDSERLYSAYAEDGFQLVSSNDHFFTDTWLSWENFIFKGDSTREAFTFGESFKYTSSEISDLFRIEVPLQIQFKHFGGQISNYDEPVETLLNVATGLRINFDLAQKQYGEAGIEYLRFLNNQLNGESSSGISEGHATWVRLHYTYKYLYLGASYWKAHNFYAPNGNTIYGSVSDYQPNTVVPERNIITNYFYLTLFPEAYFEFFLGLETYYDVDLKRLDSAIALHINLDKFIGLVTLKH